MVLTSPDDLLGQLHLRRLFTYIDDAFDHSKSFPNHNSTWDLEYLRMPPSTSSPSLVPAQPQRTISTEQQSSSLLPLPVAGDHRTVSPPCLQNSRRTCRRS